MALTRSELEQARTLVNNLEGRWGRYTELKHDVVAYVNGGPMSPKLQNELRDFLSTRLQARLDLLKASIEADVPAVTALITDYQLPPEE